MLVSLNMPRQKIKISKQSENEDESDILKPCFQVGPDVELKEVPTTGEEYLLKVMRERQKIASITTCNKDFSEFAKNQNCFVKEIPRADACDRLKPTIEWQNMQVADFSEVRMKISRLRSRKSELSSRIQTFNMDIGGDVGQWKKYFDNTDPTLSNVLGLPNAQVDLGLECLIKLLNNVKHGNTIDYKTGQWIYALLACVVQPLLSETTCILRDLARKCAEIRSHIPPDNETAAEAVAPLNIFICIVGRYFRQYDLAD